MSFGRVRRAEGARVGSGEMGFLPLYASLLPPGYSLTGKLRTDRVRLLCHLLFPMCSSGCFYVGLSSGEVSQTGMMLAMAIVMGS